MVDFQAMRAQMDAEKKAKAAPAEAAPSTFAKAAARKAAETTAAEKGGPSIKERLVKVKDRAASLVRGGVAMRQTFNPTGIRARLLLAFVVMNFITIADGANNFWSNLTIFDGLKHISNTTIPVIGALSEVAARSNALIAAAPNIVAANAMYDVQAETEALSRQAPETAKAMALMQDVVADTGKIKLVRDIDAEMTRNLDALVAVAERRIDAREALNARLEVLRVARQEERIAFDVVLRQVSGYGQETRPVYMLFTDSAEVIGLLGAAADAERIDDLAPLRERFVDAMDRIRSYNANLSAQEKEQVQPLVDRLAYFRIDAGDVFKLRQNFLALQQKARELVSANRGLAEKLDQTIGELLLVVGVEANKRTNSAMEDIEQNNIAVVVLSAIFLILSLVVDRIYVGASLVERLTRLSNSMRLLSKGNLMAPVDISGSDEIAEMAKALEVFRNAMAEDARNRARIRYLSTHDPLTGVANRAAFDEQLELLASVAEGPESRGAVLLVDLPSFKGLAQTMGQEIGDQILSEVAERMQSMVETDDMVARIGGENFALLLADASDLDKVGLLIDKMIQTLGQPILVETLSVSLAINVGVALFPDDGSEPAELMQHAVAAADQAKQAGPGQYRFYDDTTGELVAKRRLIKADLDNVVERGELRLFYQPKVDLATGEIAGMEALLRWQNAEDPEKYMTASDFVPVAELTGAIVPINAWMIREACRQAQDWEGRLGRRIRVAVNLSPSQFERQDVVAEVQAALNETGLDPSLLELEITERTVVRHPEDFITTVDNLRMLGVVVTLDDFGAGYSSLVHLQQLRIHAIKIDKSFIAEERAGPASAAIAKAIISLGRSLNLEVVAVGVESAQQRDTLRALGCHLGQGFQFAPPMPPEEATILLEQGIPVDDHLPMAASAE